MYVAFVYEKLHWQNVIIIIYKRRAQYDDDDDDPRERARDLPLEHVRPSPQRPGRVFSGPRPRALTLLYYNNV